MENGLNIIPQFNCLEMPDIERAADCFVLSDYNAGDCVLRADQQARHLYFIVSGLVCSHTTDEKVNWYEFEGQSFTDLESFLARSRATM